MNSSTEMYKMYSSQLGRCYFKEIYPKKEYVLLFEM